MAPLTLALIAFLAGGGVGSIIAYLFGKSRANEEIQRLLKIVEKLVKQNQQSLEEIASLKSQLDNLRQEIATIKKIRSVFENFIYWLLKEQPQVIELYNSISDKKKNMNMLSGKIKDNLREADKLVKETSKKYPKEIKELKTFFIKSGLKYK